MFKVALLGLFVTTLAHADYSCSVYGTDQKLTVKEVSEKEILVTVLDKTSVKKFDGVLTKGGEPGSLYKSYEYELANSMKEPAQLVISVSPRFGRACGRACQKSSLASVIDALFTKDSVKTYYVCSKTTL